MCGRMNVAVLAKSFPLLTAIPYVFCKTKMNKHIRSSSISARACAQSLSGKIASSHSAVSTQTCFYNLCFPSSDTL